MHAEFKRRTSGKRPFERPSGKLENNVKINNKEMGVSHVDRIELSQGRVQ
jgi:hypothetical protein